MEERTIERTTPSSPSAILLATAGEPFDKAVIERAVALASKGRPMIHVLSIARIWGTALGLQHPGLRPSKQEWQTQAELVAEVVKQLERRGFTAKGRVVATRNPAKAIASEALATRADVVVMGRRRPTLWSRLQRRDETGRVARRSRVPVDIVQMDM
ncbi:MAG TPA: universal stress protein [Candidatus Dormibacteraeota bacterium]|nr:universal stress protein [Candidatus Dormibacteraeota bacterium]